jgi:hypothetical protein
MLGVSKQAAQRKNGPGRQTPPDKPAPRIPAGETKRADHCISGRSVAIAAPDNGRTVSAAKTMRRSTLVPTTGIVAAPV